MNILNNYNISCTNNKPGKHNRHNTLAIANISKIYNSIYTPQQNEH